MLVKFEQNRMVRTIQNFVLYDKKWLTILEKVLTPFWKTFLSLKQLFDVKILIQSISSFIVPNISPTSGTRLKLQQANLAIGHIVCTRSNKNKFVDQNSSDPPKCVLGLLGNFEQCHVTRQYWLVRTVPGSLLSWPSNWVHNYRVWILLQRCYHYFDKNI